MPEGGRGSSAAARSRSASSAAPVVGDRVEVGDVAQAVDLGVDERVVDVAGFGLWSAGSSRRRRRGRSRAGAGSPRTRCRSRSAPGCAIADRRVVAARVDQPRRASSPIASACGVGLGRRRESGGPAAQTVTARARGAGLADQRPGAAQVGGSAGRRTGSASVSRSLVVARHARGEQRAAGLASSPRRGGRARARSIARLTASRTSGSSNGARSLVEEEVIGRGGRVLGEAVARLLEDRRLERRRRRVLHVVELAVEHVLRLLARARSTISRRDLGRCCRSGCRGCRGRRSSGCARARTRRSGSEAVISYGADARRRVGAEVAERVPRGHRGGEDQRERVRRRSRRAG